MSMEDAKLFLSRVLPWPPMGDPNAYFNIHWTFQGKGYNKPSWSGRACHTADEMVNAVAFAQKNADTRDIYLCMSSQRLADMKTSAKGHNYAAPKRLAANAVHLRSLFIDLDVKSKSYPTPADAVKALADFVRATALPRPTLCVLSGGGGMHVYWCLDVTLTPSEWQPLANALAEATRRHGLKVDTACTVDSARVLRVPGTMNHKYEPKGEVKLLTKSMQPNDVPLVDMMMALQPYMVEANHPTGVDALTPRGKLEGFTSELSAGIEARMARPVQLESIRSQCGFVEEALATGGAAFDYPLWHLATLISTFAEDGRKYAHEMAKGHKDYSHQSTEELFERKLIDKEQRNLGWPKCSSIQNAGCSHCATCPLLAQDKSPLNVGRTAPTPFTSDGDLPPGYQRDQHRRIVRIVTDEKGEVQQYLISPYAMVEGWVQQHPWTLHFKTRLDYEAKDTSISITLVDINSDGMMKRLGLQGMGVKRKESSSLQEFLVSWMKTLQNIKGRVVTAQPFGWSYEHGKIVGFCYGGNVWSDKEPRAAAAPDAVLEKQYMPVGELDKWREAADLITQQGRPALDVFIATSFAAPLLAFTGHEGCLTSAYSTESGIGKSTAMKVAQAVWGHPIRGVQGLDDTANSVLAKIGSTKNLPLFWDELKTEDDVGRFVNFTFKITGGKEKSRLHGDGTQRDLGSWQTIIMAASNDSLLDHIARKTKTTTAGIYRVFEYIVPVADDGAPKLPAGLVARTVGDLNNNFGQAGLVYAAYLGKEWQSVQKMVADLQDSLIVKQQARNDERFWIANITCCVVGAMLANKLGLTKIDVRAMTAFLIETMNNMRGVVRSTPSDMRSGNSISTIMQAFFMHVRAKHMLLIKRTPLTVRLRGRPRINNIEYLGDITRLDGVYCQTAVEDKVMHISRRYFREWCVKEKYSPHVVTNALITQWGIKEMRGTLAVGTLFAGFAEDLIEIDLSFGPASQFAASLANMVIAPEPEKQTDADTIAAAITAEP